MKTKSFSLRARADSFRYAWEGICNFFQEEHNAWIHLAASVAVIIAAWRLQLSRMEIISLVIVIGFVWVAEIFNTVVERIMNFIEPNHNHEVKMIKDIAAAAVLVAALIALITGALVFIPKFL